MDSIQFVNSAYVLLPPLLSIVLAVLTRNVLLSLGGGIVVGTLMLSGFELKPATTDLSQRVVAMVWDQGIDPWNVPLLGFLLVLGVTTEMIRAMGGANAFATWARTRVVSRRHAKFTTMLLGAIIFIDDYFNTLVVGSVAKPITDDHRVSREELAYSVDSTAAPVCVLSPISSWGAYIVGLLGGLFVAKDLADLNPLSAFIEMASMNFYAIFALITLAGVIFFDLQFGPMARAAIRARGTGQLWGRSSTLPPGTGPNMSEVRGGRVVDLILPLLVLVLASIGFMLGLGAINLEPNIPFTVIAALETTDTTQALLYAALLSLAVTLALFGCHKIGAKVAIKSFIAGAQSMLPAIYVLMFAWTMAGVIGDLQTGAYLGSLIKESMPVWLLPLLVFGLSGITALATGTSWGTFAIMLPIAADIAFATNSAMLLPLMAAVLSGSVFGDHCSPISDTTVLSATGAGCHHFDHVVTQLPYALLVACIAAGAYLVVGVTQSALLGFVTGAAILAFSLLVLKNYCRRYRLSDG